MKDLISIITPVYDTEKYVNHCIQSIVNQTREEIELILVDDGSTDHSREICDEWSRKDSRIHVIYQNHGGGGMARNIALDKAQGDFIAFVDSDDFISKDMMEFLYHQFTPDVDIVECGFYSTQSDEGKFDDLCQKYQSGRYDAEQAMKEHIQDHIFRQLIWNKMYRRRVIEKVRFPENSRIDDEFWTYKAIGNSNQLIYTDKILYAYRQQSTSVMHSIDAVKRMQAVYAKIKRHKYICKYMPNLKAESAYSLWKSCIYQGQLACRLRDVGQRRKMMQILSKIIKAYPIMDRQVVPSLKQKIWIYMAAVSLEKTCILRNQLGIGM